MPLARCSYFLAHFRASSGRPSTGIAPRPSQSWSATPGRATSASSATRSSARCCSTEGSELQAEDFSDARLGGEGSGGIALPAEGLKFEDLERDLVLAALERSGWNKSRASRLLGMDRDWLRYRIERYALKEPASRRE